MKAQLTIVALFAAFAAAAPTPAEDTSDTNFVLKFNETAAENAMKALGIIDDATSPPDKSTLISEILGNK